MPTDASGAAAAAAQPWTLVLQVCAPKQPAAVGSTLLAGEESSLGLSFDEDEG